MTTISHIGCKTLVRPLRTTFATARGSKTCATSVIVSVTCDDGSTGIGEVPTSFGIPHETTEVIKRSIRHCQRRLPGQNIDTWPSLADMLRTQFPDCHMTCSGLETALFRVWLKTTGSDEFTWWGRATKTLTSDITVPFDPDTEAIKSWIHYALRTGFDVYKIKVSGHLEQDIAFIRRVTKILDEAAKPYTLRLDGNQGFTCDSALLLLDRLGEAIELFEQPLKFDDYDGMRQLCQKAPVPIIADETVFSVEDCQRVIEYGLADGINIKIAKSGITQTRQIIAMAQKAKLKLMIGCMTETMNGLSAALCCAMGTGVFDYIDLDSVHFLHRRKPSHTIRIEGPAYFIGAPQ